MCMLFVYTLLKDVSHYDLSVLSMSVMNFQTKMWNEGCVGGLAILLFFLVIIYLSLQSPLGHICNYGRSGNYINICNGVIRTNRTFLT